MTSEKISDRLQLFLFASLSILCLALMPSNQSFWHDEVMTMIYVRAENFSAWLDLFLNQKNSEGLMPISMFWFWIVGRFGGTHEWVLRSSNIAWSLLTLFYVWRISQKVNSTLLYLLMLVHPFFWSYTGELRPYAMQIACGTGVMGCLLLRKEQLFKPSVMSRAELGLLSFLLCGTSLLGAVGWVAMVMGFAVTEIRAFPALLKRTWKEGCGLFLILLPLALFYITALLRGAGAARMWKPGISNIAFSMYEFGGWLGLASARNEIRETVRLEGFQALASCFQPFILPVLFLVAVYGLIFVLGRPCSSKSGDPSNSTRHHLFWMSLSSLFIGISVLLVAAGLARWPFWGRHLSPLFPAWIFVLGLWLDSIRSTPLRKCLSICLIGILLISSVQLRFNRRHDRDDLRSAAALALERATVGDTVWWAASKAGGEYYGLKFEDSGTLRSEVFCVASYDPSALDELPRPDVILRGRKSLHDASGAITRYAKTIDPDPTEPFASFTVWSADKRHSSNGLGKEPSD